MTGRPRAPMMFRVLMLLFPVDFTREFGREMEREFRVSLNEAQDGMEWLAVWRRAL